MLSNLSFNCYIDTCPINFKKYNYFKGNYAAIEEEMSTEDWCQGSQGLNLLESWDHLTDKLARLIEKTYQRVRYPWILLRGDHM